MTDLVLGGARVNVTYARQNGDLEGTLPFDSSDEEIISWVTEVLRSTGMKGIPANPSADLTGFIVQRFPANDEYPQPRIVLRPKVEFGNKVISQ